MPEDCHHSWHSMADAGRSRVISIPDLNIKLIIMILLQLYAQGYLEVSQEDTKHPIDGDFYKTKVH